MAKLRESGNLPYERTHALVEGWFAEPVLGQEGTVWLVLQHDSKPTSWQGEDVQVVEFVMGDYQQPFHAATGWRNVNTVMDDLSDFATDQTIDWWFDIVEGV